MRSIEKLQAEIEKLPPADVERLAEWLAEFRAQAWDKQIPEDARPGRPLRRLIDKANSISTPEKPVACRDQPCERDVLDRLSIAQTSNSHSGPQAIPNLAPGSLSSFSSFQESRGRHLICKNRDELSCARHASQKPLFGFGSATTLITNIS